MNPARAIPLRSGEKIATLGQGTWHFAESPARWAEEVASVRLGVDVGMTVIDTAEMYSNGSAEVLVSGAIAGPRSEVFLLDKVLPHHATRVGTVRRYAASLGRHINLHLLHWGDRVPLVETIEGFDELELDGMIRHWGVSNTNQILYPTRRGPEYALLPWLAQHGIGTMAYSPIEQGRRLEHPALQPITRRHNATQAQIAWALQHDRVNAIPDARTPSHVRQNATAGDIDLTRNDLYTLDRIPASYPDASVRSSGTALSVQVSPLWPWLSAAEFRS